MIIFIDLFCGAGGVTTGIERARHNKKKLGKVIACVNHDPIAIKSHAQNHQNVLHFVEDIRTLDLFQLSRLTDFYKQKYPQAAFAIWASLECTNFSKAKGGKPRDADSRTLAEHLYRYIQALSPDYVFIENVVEFMSWGPLDDYGKPISKHEGIDYLKWKEHIESMGFRYGHKILNAADYGAYTKRERYFAQFAKADLPIQWPTATHTKKPSDDMFGGLQKWKPVKEVLDFSDEGKSIFDRKKPLSEKTLQRIHAGLIKYVAGGDKTFLSKYFSGDPKSKNISVEEPAGALTTIDHHSLVQVKDRAFIAKYLSNNAKTGVNAGASVNEPSPTVTTQNRLGLVQIKDNPSFITKYYSTGENISSVEEPAGTLTTKDRMNLVQANWLDRQFSSGGRDSSIEDPAGTIMTVPKMNLVTVDKVKEKHYYLTNPQWLSSTAQSVDEPCFTLIARMDKAPPSIVVTESGVMTIIIHENDSLFMKKIKEFMSVYGIVDIKMRMLKVPELLKIQGFPKGYKLSGTQADQKKFIGNSVVPQIAEAIIAEASKTYVEHYNLKLAA